MKTLCIVDNALKDFVGHHFEYSRCLVECAARRGEPIVVLGHRDIDERIRCKIPVEPVFSRSPYQFPTTLPILRYAVNPLVQNYLFFRDLRRALNGRTTKNWIVFAPAVTHNQILGWAAWLNGLPPGKAPAVVLFVRNSYRDGSNPKYYDKRAYFAWIGYKWVERMAAVGKRIHLVSDSERLVEEFSKLTHLPFKIMPTPHTKRPAPPTQPVKPGRFVWLGGIRKDKGFIGFAEAILHLDRELHAGCIEFVIQSNLDSPHDTETAAAREKLKAAGLPGVTLIERPLSADEYTELLQSAGAVVIPRLLQLYRSQTSGPFVEALAAGKPVVVTDDSWMSEQLKQYGAGVTFKDQDAASLANAIRTLAARHEEFKLRAETSANEWCGIHNPDRLYDLLHGLAR